MNKLLVSLFVTGLASAAPAAVWADQEHTQHPPTGSAHPSSMSGPSHSMSGPSTSHSMGAPHGSSMYHHTVTHHTTVDHRTIMYHHTTTTVGGNRYHDTTTHAHIDRNNYHKNITAERRFHWGVYRAPRGYEYRRWSYGERLPGIYFGQDYWITNYLNFGLPWAPDGCEWVRFGPDAILVDIDTGEILEVEYGVFY
jgi:Ni/Co efflux regulator RcnB